MDKKNLENVFKAYYDKFETFNKDTDKIVEKDEGYKWNAVQCFRDNWDIEAEDFSDIFNKSVRRANKITETEQSRPNGGIKILLKNGEVEFVRECFRKLFTDDDNGDLDKRQKRMDEFSAQINSHVMKYKEAVNSDTYNQKNNSVLCYLSLWKPEENYMYKRKAADAFANYIDFDGYFGAGSTFSLEQYYKMCDEILEEVKKDEGILEKNRNVVKKRARDFDDKLHLLVYDIIWSTYSYKLCDIDSVPKIPAKKRAERAKAKKEKEELNRKIEELRSNLKELNDSQVKLPDLVGCAVKHKVFGDGVVISHRLDSKKNVYFKAAFDQKQPELLYPDFVNSNFITFKDSAITENARTMVRINDEIKEVEKEIDHLKSQSK